MLVFSTDDALIPFATLPSLALPSPRVINVLDRLSADPNNIIYIISGRDRKTLLKWFGSYPIGLVAEHGFFITDKVNTADVSQTVWETLEHECDLS